MTDNPISALAGGEAESPKDVASVESVPSSSESPAATAPLPEESSETALPTETELADTSTELDQTLSELAQEAEPTEPTVVNEPESEDAILDALLNRIAPVGGNGRLKWLIFSEPGGGKSSILGTAPNQLIYDMEDGAVAMKGVYNPVTGEQRVEEPNIKSIPFKSFWQGEMLVDRLAKEVPQLDWVKVFSLDTLSDFHKRGLGETLYGKHLLQPSRSRYKAETEDHSENNEHIIQFVRSLRDLPQDIIVTCHAKTIQEKGSLPRTQLDFSESLSNRIMAMFDVVGYLKWVEIDGVIRQVMQVHPDGIVQCKTRMPLPADIIDPNYKDIKEAWVKFCDAEAAAGRPVV